MGDLAGQISKPAFRPVMESFFAEIFVVFYVLK